MTLSGATAQVAGTGRYRHTEDGILDAACAVFAEAGFEAAKMSTIAARAGTTKPTLYARFGSKDKLFVATVRREQALLDDHLAAAYDDNDDAPFRERLHRWVIAYFDFVKERPASFQLAFESERPAIADAAVAEITNARIDSIAELVIRVSGRPKGAGPRVVAAMIVGMVRWCVREAVQRPGTDVDTAAQLCESMLYQCMTRLDVDLMDTITRRSRRRSRA